MKETYTKRRRKTGKIQALYNIFTVLFTLLSRGFNSELAFQPQCPLAYSERHTASIIIQCQILSKEQGTAVFLFIIMLQPCSILQLCRTLLAFLLPLQLSYKYLSTTEQFHVNTATELEPLDASFRRRKSCCI